MDELITVTQAAELLDVGRSTIAKLIDTGRLEAFRLPGGDGRGKNRAGFMLYVRKGDVERMKDGSWRRSPGPQPKTQEEK